jgi:hypothetical protein
MTKRVRRRKYVENRREPGVEAAVHSGNRNVYVGNDTWRVRPYRSDVWIRTLGTSCEF